MRKVTLNDLNLINTATYCDHVDYGIIITELIPKADSEETKRELKKIWTNKYSQDENHLDMN